MLIVSISINLGFSAKLKFAVRNFFADVLSVSMIKISVINAFNIIIIIKI